MGDAQHQPPQRFRALAGDASPPPGSPACRQRACGSCCRSAPEAVRPSSRGAGQAEQRVGNLGRQQDARAANRPAATGCTPSPSTPAHPRSAAKCAEERFSCGGGAGGNRTRSPCRRAPRTRHNPGFVTGHRCFHIGHCSDPRGEVRDDEEAHIRGKISHVKHFVGNIPTFFYECSPNAPADPSKWPRHLPSRSSPTRCSGPRGACLRPLVRLLIQARRHISGGGGRAAKPVRRGRRA